MTLRFYPLHTLKAATQFTPEAVKTYSKKSIKKWKWKKWKGKVKKMKMKKMKVKKWTWKKWKWKGESGAVKLKTRKWKKWMWKSSMKVKSATSCHPQAWLANEWLRGHWAPGMRIYRAAGTRHRKKLIPGRLAATWCCYRRHRRRNKKILKRLSFSALRLLFSWNKHLMISLPHELRSSIDFYEPTSLVSPIKYKHEKGEGLFVPSVRGRSQR